MTKKWKKALENVISAETRPYTFYFKLDIDSEIQTDDGLSLYVINEEQTTIPVLPPHSYNIPAVDGLIFVRSEYFGNSSRSVYNIHTFWELSFDTKRDLEQNLTQLFPVALCVHAGIKTEQTYETLFNQLQILCNQKVDNLSQLTPTRYPTCQNTLFSAYHWPKISAMFDRPEEFVKLDALSLDDYVLPQHKFSFYKPGVAQSVSTQGTHRYIVEMLRKTVYYPQILAESGYSPHLRKLIIAKLIDTLNQKIMNDLHAAGANQANLPSFLTDHPKLHLDKFWNGFTRWSLQSEKKPTISHASWLNLQTIPLFRLILGHSTWDVSEINIGNTTLYQKAIHTLKWLSGYYFFHQFYKRYLKQKDCINDDFESFLNMQEERSTDIMPYIIDILCLLACTAIALCLLLCFLDFNFTLFTEVVNWLMSTPVLTKAGICLLLFLYDADLKNKGKGLQSSIEILCRSIYNNLILCFSVFGAMYSSLSTIISLPTIILKKCFLSNLDTTWFQHYEENKDKPTVLKFCNDLLYYGGHLDILITLCETVFVNLAIYTFMPSYLISYALFATATYTVAATCITPFISLLDIKLQYTAKVFTHYSELGVDNMKNYFYPKNLDQQPRESMGNTV